MPLLALPPELLLDIVSQLYSTQDFIAVSTSCRQLRACCNSMGPKSLRQIMERTLEGSFGKETCATYIEELRQDEFCTNFLSHEKHRQKYRNTNENKRYLIIRKHDTKDVCSGCLTLAMVLRYCWYPWVLGRGGSELRNMYKQAIKRCVSDPDKFTHDLQ
ncbi:hypothetical protein BZA77DRAFT_126237 [Pyronema omphalodes]|nr:hypothetical protein BZA77DRAFT_126237 [Pyronema omphalodes]